MANEVKQKDKLYNPIFSQIKFSLTEKISSFYTEILSFIAQYSFLFDEFPAETKPLPPDPARDGENWFAYVNNDPVNFVDLLGLSAVDKQTAYDESDVHCDIYAWNGALDNGKDPRGQNGENPDLNNTTVTEFYKLFPDNRNSTPPDNTKGYMFYDATNDNVDNPTHVEFYDNTNSNPNTFIENRTGGKTPPVPTEREMNDERNSNWTFVPLPDL